MVSELTSYMVAMTTKINKINPLVAEVMFVEHLINKKEEGKKGNYQNFGILGYRTGPNESVEIGRYRRGQCVELQG